ncbi:hypothetical protein NECAME_00399 [Necator americanus]|uniref:Uncharacterized protein n=1 Tax=Necator americanus TaxID=51031 RepID=W2TAY8_NECAM|nr:hypothetical protein NECAME_00399 [Necator americanus]ETN79023.1 hypothetical protein NECAME_00399 [Necator americanus]
MWPDQLFGASTPGEDQRSSTSSFIFRGALDDTDSYRFRTWWTLTCNFGNIQPLDFDKSAIRRRMMPALDLKERKKCKRVYSLVSRPEFNYPHQSQPFNIYGLKGPSGSSIVYARTDHITAKNSYCPEKHGNSPEKQWLLHKGAYPLLSPNAMDVLEHIH